WDYTIAIGINQQDAASYFNRGEAYSQLKQYQLASEDTAQAHRLDPNCEAASLNPLEIKERDAQLQGGMLLIQENYAEAVVAYNQAINLDPKASLAYFGRGQAYDALEQYEKAADEFSIAIRLDPTIGSTYYHRGLVYERLGMKQRAIADYTATIERP